MRSRSPMPAASRSPASSGVRSSTPPTCAVELVCFEAGQREEELDYAATVSYQVLEGEALVRSGDELVRLGKGRLLRVDPGRCTRWRTPAAACWSCCRRAPAEHAG